MTFRLTKRGWKSICLELTHAACSRSYSAFASQPRTCRANKSSTKTQSSRPHPHRTRRKRIERRRSEGATRRTRSKCSPRLRRTSSASGVGCAAVLAPSLRRSPQRRAGWERGGPDGPRTNSLPRKRPCSKQNKS